MSSKLNGQVPLLLAEMCICADLGQHFIFFRKPIQTPRMVLAPAAYFWPYT